LWHGLPTMPPRLTVGLLPISKTRDLRSGPWRGRETTPPREPRHNERVLPLRPRLRLRDEALAAPQVPGGHAAIRPPGLGQLRQHLLRGPLFQAVLPLGADAQAEVVHGEHVEAAQREDQ